MNDLISENEQLKKKIDLLLDENKQLKLKCDNLIKFNKYKRTYEIKLENDDLKKKLESKYDDCIKEKQALKDEIDELIKLLEHNYDSKRKIKKTETTICC
jgi:regulator of replication initiation timing